MQSEQNHHIESNHLRTIDQAYIDMMKGGFIAERRSGCVLLSGSDVIPFLQGMTTNDVTKMREGENSVITIVINEKARIIDVLRLIRDQDSILAITSPDMGGEVYTWLKKFIIMEDVKIADVTSRFKVYYVYGDDVKYKFQSRLAQQLGSEFTELTEPFFFFQDPLWHVPLYCVVTRDSIERYGLTGDLLKPELFEVFRIEQGIPVLGSELTKDINPLEANLKDFISDTKGCYIGQEVIARIQTYKKQQQHLVGFIFDKFDDRYLEKGVIYCNGKPEGFTTSHAWSPLLGRFIALGYVRSSVEAGNVDFRSEKVQGGAPVKICRLPFNREGFK